MLNDCVQMGMQVIGRTVNSVVARMKMVIAFLPASHDRRRRLNTPRQAEILESRFLLTTLGDIDGDSDFDANDTFLIQLVSLSASDSDIDIFKGASERSAAQIRAAVDRLRTAGDIDRSGDFDANDAFLAHVIQLAAADPLIEQFQGASSETVEQLRQNTADLDTRQIVDVPTLEAARQQLGSEISGATIITHGFQLTEDGDALLPLAEAIFYNTGGWLVNYGVTEEGGVPNFKITPMAGEGKEVVLLFDWAAESNEPSPGWGEAAGDALFNIAVGLGAVTPDLGLNNDTPLHFIAHSFGAAVASEAIERLAYFDVPVDQVTYLDPHDFDEPIVPIDGSQQLYTLGLPQVGKGYGATVWDNVDFADVYYQTDQLPSGRPVAGAHNVFLPDDIFQSLNPHSEVWETIYLDSVRSPNGRDLYSFSRLSGGENDRPASYFFTPEAAATDQRRFDLTLYPTDFRPNGGRQRPGEPLIHVDISVDSIFINEGLLLDDLVIGNVAYTFDTNTDQWRPEPEETETVQHEPTGIANGSLRINATNQRTNFSLEHPYNAAIGGVDDIFTSVTVSLLFDKPLGQIPDVSVTVDNGDTAAHFRNLPYAAIDHSFTESDLVRYDELLDVYVPNDEWLSQNGFTSEQFNNVRWPAQWTPEVFNGDIQFPGDEFDGVPLTGDNSVPGWSQHAGGGDGFVDDAGSNFFIELDFGNTQRSHNWIFFPRNFDRLYFDLTINIPSDNDTLAVSIGTDVELVNSDLSEVGTTRFSLELAPYSGEVQAVTFALLGGGLFEIVDSELFIDNLSFFSTAT